MKIHILRVPVSWMHAMVACTHNQACVWFCWACARNGNQLTLELSSKVGLALVFVFFANLLVLAQQHAAYKHIEHVFRVLCLSLQCGMQVCHVCGHPGLLVTLGILISLACEACNSLNKRTHNGG